MWLMRLRAVAMLMKAFMVVRIGTSRCAPSGLSGKVLECGRTGLLAVDTGDTGIGVGTEHTIGSSVSCKF